MEKLRKLLIFLSQFELSSSKIDLILDILGDDASVTAFSKQMFDEKVLSAEQASKMKNLADEAMVDNLVKDLENKDIIILTKIDEDYPEKLKDLDDNPYCLFCKGDISLLSKPSISVVGTRKPSNYGKMVTNKLVGDIASAGVVVISGLAYGIDSIAHRKALEEGGKTIAVLGGGFDHIYPAEHTSLAKEIEEKGLLVTEYLPSKISTKYTFPQRNRIIAGLGDGILITEANLKSGTIHTKEFALEYGKNIYAVPGNIDSDLSSLPNELIKTGQSSAVTCSKDILDDYDVKSLEKTIYQNYSIEEEMIINLLKDGGKEIDEIVKATNFNINLVNSCLTSLEINGIISRMPGNVILLN